ncbi:molybdenum cofactor guanylyltransferase [Bacillus sp. FJAT-49736]|uniref:molybdenum cofactor guanylyltransferase n=1 Tax=Bacillus sp. FJAT-49736 TaxID=2833582 RepID=UPI001BCA61C7|nr:molybdenum cofactor guanylyltransferase [Bacillus sp. FJAT-49736]MBS4175361.1 molybdenum cofactor guanylyltransferase [Bacillus sp. FJAT-49736]
MKTVILAGGKSRRMGQNKALLPLGEKSIIQRLVEDFTTISEEIIIIANIPEIYSNLGIRIFSDAEKFKGDGPLAGIYTGLDVANTACLFIACDMPFASPALGEFMKEVLENSKVDVVIPSYKGRIHPLFGVYHHRIKSHINELLLNDKRKMSQLINEVNAKIIEKQDIPIDLQDKWEYCLWNMNTMEDYQKALEFYKNKNRL